MWRMRSGWPTPLFTGWSAGSFVADLQITELEDLVRAGLWLAVEPVG